MTRIESRRARHLETDLTHLLSDYHEPTTISTARVRTGLEDFDVLWRGAPASVRQRWSQEAVEDMWKYSRQVLSPLPAP
jgi:hypothetical protein